MKVLKSFASFNFIQQSIYNHKVIALSGLFFLLPFLSSTTHAQVDISVNPLNLILFNTFSVSGDFVLSEYGSIEVGGRISDNEDRGNQLKGFYKYYFNPEHGADKFYIGAFTNFTKTREEESDDSLDLGFGFGLGYKVLSKKGVFFDVNLGVGRSTSDLGVTGIGNFNVGYRIKTKNSQKAQELAIPKE